MGDPAIDLEETAPPRGSRDFWPGRTELVDSASILSPSAAVDMAAPNEDGRCALRLRGAEVFRP